MEQLINRMKALSDAWKAQFDNPPKDLEFSWDMDPNTGKLKVNNIDLCYADTILPQGERFDVEFLELPTVYGCCRIVIAWPFDGPAEIDKIIKRHCVDLSPFCRGKK